MVREMESSKRFRKVNNNLSRSLVLNTEYSSVSKNGKLISKVFQEENAHAGSGEAPQFKKLTKIDIPDLNIHRQFFDEGPEAGESARLNHVKRNVRTGQVARGRP